MASTASSASASATTTGVSSALTMPRQFRVVGIILAVVSGLLIGASFVFKKKGLIKSQAGGPAGEGVGYLKSGMWWVGMIMMILGEICNFAAYAFVEAIVVTPLGALSVVVCAILSSIFINEKLTFFGWIGCFLCIVGSVIIALNGPREGTVPTIREFEKLFVSVGFLVYGGVVIAASIIIVFFVAPKYGKKSMIWYILVCSLIGGLSVSCIQALGSSIVTSIRGQNQFTYWFIYFLLVFVIITLLTEIYYLNVALALFNTAMVTPTYYVIFTFCTLVTSVILYQGFKATATDIITVVMGFLVICAGITILQMSKVDPTTLSRLDRKSTMLLQANRPTEDAEKGEASAFEEPGVDAIRGSFGAFGSIVRARSMASSKGTLRSRHATHGHSREDSASSVSGGVLGRLPSLGGLKRHQLFDNPVPPLPEDSAERISLYSNMASPRPPKAHLDGAAKKNMVIQFRETDLAGHDHFDVTEQEARGAELALDDFIQRTTSPGTPGPAGTGTGTAPSTVTSARRQLYDDPYAYSPRAAGTRYDPFSLRQDSLASLPEHGGGTGTTSPEGVESPPRSGHTRSQRAYPQNHELDREESVSLVGGREMGFENDRDDGSDAMGGHGGLTNGGIRLLPSLPRR